MTSRLRGCRSRASTRKLRGSCRPAGSTPYSFEPPQSFQERRVRSPSPIQAAMPLRTVILCATTLSMLSAVQAQAGQAAAPANTVHPNEHRFRTGDVTVRRWVDGGVAHTARSRDGGASWQPLLDADDRVHHVLAKFDPAMAPLQLPGPMAAPPGTRLFLVQFQTQVLDEYRTAVTLAGAQILYYQPANLLCVRCDAHVAANLRGLSCVRWVGPLQNGFKLDDELRGFATGRGSARECNLVLASK